MAETTTTPQALELSPQVTRNLQLRCLQCGTSAVYDVGIVLYEPEGLGASVKTPYAYSFTGYFRCQHCNSAGPWEVEEKLKLLGMRAQARLNPRFTGLQKGHFALVDGTVLQTPAMAEDYLLKQIEAQPRDASLYRRLGNVFRVAAQDPKAGQWYAKAVALDPHDLDSRYNLFMLAIVAHDIPATVLHARLLVQDLLAGHSAQSQEGDVTVNIAENLVEDLRAAPDAFRHHFLDPKHGHSTAPEDVFIRTLLTQEGEEEDILDDATDRLLDGVPEPSELVAESLLDELPEPIHATPPTLSPTPKLPTLALVPSLAQVIQTQGLEPTQLVIAYNVPSANHIRLEDRHKVLVSDGQKAAVWQAPPLAELYRGNKIPPPDMDHFSPQYVPHFFFVETRLLTICDLMGDRTDQEMEEIYAALRRRPDGRSPNVAYDLVWQIMALLLGTRELSAAEHEALISALLGSARRWGLRPISRNYVAYLRQAFGHPRPVT